MRDLERVGDDLAAVLKRLGLAGPGAATRVVEEWAEIAGEPWSRTSRPAGIRDGVLQVEAVDGASASLLKFHTSELVERIAATVGAGVVRAVRITVSGRKKGL